MHQHMEKPTKTRNKTLFRSLLDKQAELLLTLWIPCARRPVRLLPRQSLVPACYYSPINLTAICQLFCQRIRDLKTAIKMRLWRGTLAIPDHARTKLPDCSRVGLTMTVDLPKFTNDKTGTIRLSSLQFALNALLHTAFGMVCLDSANRCFVPSCRRPPGQRTEKFPRSFQ